MNLMKWALPIYIIFGTFFLTCCEPSRSGSLQEQVYNRDFDDLVVKQTIDLIFSQPNKFRILPGKKWEYESTDGHLLIRDTSDGVNKYEGCKCNRCYSITVNYGDTYSTYSCTGYDTDYLHKTLKWWEANHYNSTCLF